MKRALLLFAGISLCCAAIDGLSIRLVDAAPEQEKSAGEDFIFKTEVHVDLLLHALAHMDLGDDDANLYSEGYVGTILKEKQALGLKADLKDRLDAMKEVFISDTGMGGLRMIDFLPFYITDYKDFIGELNWLATDSEDHHKNPRIDSFKRYITRQEQREFIKALSGILDEEYRTFYRDYWKREQERLADVRRQFEGFVRTNGEKLFSPVIRKELEKMFRATFEFSDKSVAAIADYITKL